MKLKISKVKPEAVIPTKAHDSDIGFDMYAISEEVVDKGDYGYIEYDTGISVQPEPGYGCFIFPRSSISNTGLLLSNCVGVIDPGYTGSIKARFKYVSKTKKYGVGDKICQLVVLPIPKVELEVTEELTATDRNSNGFGSSGN